MNHKKSQYDEDGFVCFEDPPFTFLNQVDQAYQRAVKMAETPHRYKLKWLHKTGRVKHIINPHLKEPIFAELIQSDFIKKSIKELIGEQPLYVTHSKISYKCYGIKQEWQPHQDSGYKFRLGELEGASILIHLEDCDKSNGAIEMYPKSHLGGRIKHNITFVDGEKDPQVYISKMTSTSSVVLNCKKGTIACLHPNTVHSSGTNSKSRIGMNQDYCWQQISFCF